jgi:hypothetical protein
MPTLEQISIQIRDLATLKAPVKTGNLRNRIQQYNRPQRGGMIKETKSSFTIDLNYGPPGAEYGMWWNDPTLAKNIKNGKSKNIPDSINFANNALNSDIVSSMLDRYIEDKVDAIITKNIKEMLDTFDEFE